ncbi:hypothetical protein K439DRAFT_1612795 [Ramaria rubella]|nr:hypothetical protein K439DRAFT_1612795 [Ramaria rubella]
MRKNIYLSTELKDEAINMLSQLDLRERFPKAVKEWDDQNKAIDAKFKEGRKIKSKETESKLLEQHPQRDIALENSVILEILPMYGPFFSTTDLVSEAFAKLGQAEIFACMGIRYNVSRTEMDPRNGTTKPEASQVILA